jgi:16S rRNA (uracil1498-N3)-methyltransferase
VSARRLFAADLPRDGGVLRLGEDAARHARVLRLVPGDAVELFDGEGRRASGRITQIAPALVCEVGAPVAISEPMPRVHLVLGLPKSGTLDDAVRAATEAGASSVHLLVAANSVGRRPAAAGGRPARLERVVREASRQCERDLRPALHAPVDLPTLLARVPEGHAKLVASARQPGPWPALSSDDVWVAVGPEGGFRGDEEDALARAGFEPVSLGPYVLRAVTAAPVAVALARARAGSCFS